MYFEEIELGRKIDLEPVVIKKETILNFGKNYDPLPLHTDEEYAKKSPFGKLVAPGVMSFMLVWSKFLETGFLGDELLVGKSTKMEWHKPVFAEDVLTGKATITKHEKRNKRNGLVEIKVEVYNQKGVLVLTDFTEVIVKCKP